MQRQLQGTTVNRLNRCLLRARNNRTIRSNLILLRARRARQQRIELRFHARRANAFSIDRTNHRSSNIPIGERSFVGGFPLNAVNIQSTNLSIRHRINIALHIRVGRVTQKQAAKLRFAHLQKRSQLAGGLDRASSHNLRLFNPVFLRRF